MVGAALAIIWVAKFAHVLGKLVASSRGVWQGVTLDSPYNDLGPLFPTFLCLVGSYTRGGSLQGGRPIHIFYPLGIPKLYTYAFHWKHSPRDRGVKRWALGGIWAFRRGFMVS
jgi:hypothetical protein